MVRAFLQAIATADVNVDADDSGSDNDNDGPLVDESVNGIGDDNNNYDDDGSNKGNYDHCHHNTALLPTMRKTSRLKKAKLRLPSSLSLSY